MYAGYSMLQHATVIALRQQPGSAVVYSITLRRYWTEWIPVTVAVSDFTVLVVRSSVDE